MGAMLKVHAVHHLPHCLWNLQALEIVLNLLQFRASKELVLGWPTRGMEDTFCIVFFAVDDVKHVPFKCYFTCHLASLGISDGTLRWERVLHTMAASLDGQDREEYS